MTIPSAARLYSVKAVVDTARPYPVVDSINYTVDKMTQQLRAAGDVDWTTLRAYVSRGPDSLLQFGMTVQMR